MSDAGAPLDTIFVNQVPPSLVIEVYSLTPVGPPGPVGPMGPPGADGFIPEPVGPGSYGRLATAAWNPVLPLAGDTMTGGIVLVPTQLIDGGTFA